LAKIVRYASCGAFALLCLGAIFTYRQHQKHRRKIDVFVDVSGNFSFLFKIPLSHNNALMPCRKQGNVRFEKKKIILSFLVFPDDYKNDILLLLYFFF